MEHAPSAGKHCKRQSPLDLNIITKKGVRKDFKEVFYETSDKAVDCNHFWFDSLHLCRVG